MSCLFLLKEFYISAKIHCVCLYKCLYVLLSFTQNFHNDTEKNMVGRILIAHLKIATTVQRDKCDELLAVFRVL